MGGFGQFGTLAGLGSDVETGDDPGSEAQAALGGALGGGTPAAAAAQAPAAGGGPGGSGIDLSQLSQIMGSLGQMGQPQQPPAGMQVTQRHGGLLTGLAGVLLDGLASGMAPTRQQAFEMPFQRQQQQAQLQMQQQELQLRQQQAQQEMAMAPFKMKAQMAQTAINVLQADHMLRGLQKEHWIDMMGAQGKYIDAAIDEGRARLDATAPTLDDAIKRTKELQANNKDTALNYGYAPTKWDKDGNPTEFGVYEAYPHGALQKAFDYDFAGDDKLGIKAEHVHLPAGMQESEARLKLSTVANEHAATMRMAQDHIELARLQEEIKYHGVEAGLRARQVTVEEARLAQQNDPVAIGNLARGLVEGDVDPSQVGKPGSRTGTALLLYQAADEYSKANYNQPFNAAKAQSDYNYAKQTQTQNTLKYLDSLTGRDNKSGNLQELVNASSKVPLTTRFPALNDTARWAELQAGMPEAASYRATIIEVADQVAKILQGGGTGSGTSDAKLQEAKELFNRGFNPEQISAVANSLRDLLANRKSSMIGDNRYLQRWFGPGGTAPGARGATSATQNEAAQFGGVPR